MSIFNLINNKLDFNENKNFTAIIGSNPSEGARSPILWNYCFEQNKIDCKMLCFDVDENNIKKLIDELNNNKYFLGGAIAMPYKENIFNILEKNISQESNNIGAINCLFRNNYGKLCGTNTDGEAALLALEEKTGKIENKKILLLGPGGAGKAVSAYLLKSLKNSKNLFISGRSNKGFEFSKKINCEFIEWNKFENIIEKFDIIINCTSVGSKNFEKNSPLSIKIIDKIKIDALVYDIIYDPSPTKLIYDLKQKNIKTIDGKKMNLLQAALAFDYCININFRKFNTFDTMLNIFKKLD